MQCVVNTEIKTKLTFVKKMTFQIFSYYNINYFRTKQK